MVQKSIESHLPVAVRQVIKELGELIALGRKEKRFTQAELVDSIETRWNDAADLAQLSIFESDLLRRGTVLSPGIYS